MAQLPGWRPPFPQQQQQPPMPGQQAGPQPQHPPPFQVQQPPYPAVPMMQPSPNGYPLPPNGPPSMMGPPPNGGYPSVPPQPNSAMAMGRPPPPFSQPPNYGRPPPMPGMPGTAPGTAPGYPQHQMQQPPQPQQPSPPVARPPPPSFPPTVKTSSGPSPSSAGNVTPPDMEGLSQQPAVPISPASESAAASAFASQAPRRRAYPAQPQNMVSSQYGISPGDTVPLAQLHQPTQPYQQQQQQMGNGGFVPGQPQMQQPQMQQPPPQQHTLVPSQSTMQFANQFANMNIAGAPGSASGLSQMVPLTNMRPAVEELEADMIQTTVTPSQFAVSPSTFVPCPRSFKRCTLNAIPATTSLLKQARTPFVVILHPFKHIEEGETVPVLGGTSRQDYGQPVYDTPSIVRCRRCRTYINPFVQIENNTNWRCNVCYLTNELPPHFNGFDPTTQQYFGPYHRPELNHCIVDYIAPTDYMIRPPQPPVFVFVVDVSVTAIRSGMVDTFARTLVNTLDSIPDDDGRTRVAFITYDSTIHFYQLLDDEPEPRMMVISDLDEPFLPMPETLLVNMSVARPAIETLMERLSSLHQNTVDPNSAMGSAMDAAYQLVSPLGGKIVTFSATLPNVGNGALKPREDRKAMGTSSESSLLQPVSSFYKNFAISCAKTYVTVDMFLFGTQFLDIASSICTPRYTGGSIYYYPGFNAGRSEDATKFSSELTHYLCRPLGLEAVFRMRCTKGIRAESFFGNFFLRSSDLLSLPTVSPDNAYAFQLTLEENLAVPVGCFQSALLYTTNHGERRIRVVTIALPATSDLAELYRNLDQQAMICALSKMAVERALTAKLEDARDALINKCVDLLGVYKSVFSSGGNNPQLLAGENMKFLPLLILAILKHMAIRGGSQVPLDVRSSEMNLLRVLPTELMIPFLYPRLYELYTMPPHVGLPEQGTGDGSPSSPMSPSGAMGKIVMPTPVNLSSERLVSHGFFLLDAGTALFLWIGRAAPPALIRDVFAVPSFEALQSGKIFLPVTEAQFNHRIHNILRKIREKITRRNYYPPLYLVKEEGGDPELKMQFMNSLVEDRHDFGPNYAQFLLEIRERVNKGSF